MTGTILVVALFADSTAAQNATVPNAFRFSAMGSFGFAVPFVATELGLTVNRGPHDLTLRLAEALDFGGPHIEAIGDAAILYGLRSRSSRGWLRASAGIGRVRRGYGCDEILFCALYGSPSSTNWDWHGRPMPFGLPSLASVSAQACLATSIQQIRSEL